MGSRGEEEMLGFVELSFPAALALSHLPLFSHRPHVDRLFPHPSPLPERGFILRFNSPH